jgi:hypothetical protein
MKNNNILSKLISRVGDKSLSKIKSYFIYIIHLRRLPLNAYDLWTPSF